jgi:predicted amidohydrolase
MEQLKIATAQFEHRSGEKGYNLAVMGKLAAEAAGVGAQVISFHECSVTGYTFARHLSQKEMLGISERIPEGESVGELMRIAAKEQIVVLAGLFEKDDQDRIYKAYVCVDGQGLIAKFRKLHPFINPHILPGNAYCVFDLEGWKCGILICYDNNIVENVRATCLLGAEILFMPHVTMGTPSPAPGRGFIDTLLWENRESDPLSLRREFDGPKGRDWLMKWLPARAWDNGVYCVFSNPVGMDDDQVRNGCSMIVDPFGDILAECRSLGDEICWTVCNREKITLSGGFRYTRARRPELYGEILAKAHRSVQHVAWMDKGEKQTE